MAHPSELGVLLEVTGWSFQPDTSSLPPVRRLSDVDSPTWAGQMVASGTVQVTGLLGGRPDTAAAHVEVRPRDWSGQVLGLDLSENSPGKLLDKPDTASDLGAALLGTAFNEETLTPALYRVPQGPNEGYEYFTDFPFRATATVSINTTALAAGSAFDQLQERSRRIINDTLYCDHDDVVDLYLPGVRAHEGIRGRLDTNSHVAIFVDRLEREARARVEGMVSRESFPGFLAALQQMDSIASVDSEAMHTDGRNPFKPACSMHYFRREERG